MAYPYRLSELEIILNKKADETSVIKALTIIHKDMLQETKTKAYATPNFMEALLCKYRRNCKLSMKFFLQNSQHTKIPNET